MSNLALMGFDPFILDGDDSSEGPAYAQRDGGDSSDSEDPAYAQSDDDDSEQAALDDREQPAMSDETGFDRLLSVAEAAGEIGERASLQREQVEIQKAAEQQQRKEDKQAFDDATEKRNKRLEAQSFDDSPPMALWSLWIRSLVDTANASPEQSARFQENANWVEDLEFGPNDFGRIYSGGFVRQPVDGEDQIVWMVKNDDEVTALATAATVFQLCADWISGPKTDTCPFEPMRLPLVNVNRQRQAGYADDAGIAQTDAERMAIEKTKGVVRYRRDKYKLPMLDNVTGLVLEESIPAEEYRGGMRRVKEAKGGKWMRNADGSCVLVPRRGPVMHSTDVLRLVIQPIRLNEHHFEWQYSRWLENEKMFEPATLFTSLRDAENSWRTNDDKGGCPELTRHQNAPGDPRLWSGSSLAIPLMTPGSMNALGVVVQKPPADKLVNNLNGVASQRERNLQERQKSLNPKTALDGVKLPREDDGRGNSDTVLHKFRDRMPRFAVGMKPADMPPIKYEEGSKEYSLGYADGYYYTIYDEAPEGKDSLEEGMALSHKAILVRSSRYEPNGTFRGSDESDFDPSNAPSSRYSSFHINAIGVDADAYEWLVNGTRPTEAVLNSWERLFYGGGIVRIQSPALADNERTPNQQWRSTIGPMHDMRINKMYPNRDRDQALRFSGQQGGEHRRVYSEVYSRVFFEPVALTTMETFPKASARYNHFEPDYVKEDHPCEGEYLTYSFRWAQWKRSRQDEYLKRLNSNPTAQKDDPEAAEAEGGGEEDAMGRDDVEDEELEGGWAAEVDSANTDSPMLPGGIYAPKNPREHRYIPPRVHPRFRRELSPLYAEVVMRRPHGDNEERIRARMNDVTRALRGERGWDKGKHPTVTVSKDWKTVEKKVDKEKQTWLEREEVDDKDDFTRLNIGNKKTPANVFEKKQISLPDGRLADILRPTSNPREQKGLHKALLDAIDEKEKGRYRYMSPTTIGDAMDRFVRDHRRQLDFYPNVQNGGCEDYLLPKIGEGGLYLSPRMDHGREERCGGVDSFFPVSDDATVYELADIQMVRGLHEILRDRDKPGVRTRDDEDEWKLTKARWGAPEWYTKERAKQQKNTNLEAEANLAYEDYEASKDHDLHGYDPDDASKNKDMKWYTFYGAYAGARAALEKTLEAQTDRKGDRTRVTLNEFQKQRLDMAHLGNANVSGKGLNDDTLTGTVRSTLERAFWNIWRPDENADLVAFPKYRLPVEIQFYNRTQDSDGRINGMSVLAHSATDESKRMLDGRVGGLHFMEANGPLLEKISEIEDDDERRTAAENLMGEDGLAKNERRGARLPHEEDMYDELAIFYPNRLSSASRAAVYDRMKAMDTKNKPDVGAGYRGLGAVLGEGMKGYVPEDRDMAVPGQRALDPRKPGKMLAPQRDALKEQRAASGRSTVVAPVYVVILDHDDYENARKKGDIAWAKLMKKHPTYFKEADRYKLLFDANGNATGMEINRDYVLPGKAFPPRTEGEPRTFDAPHEHEDYTFDERDESGAMQTYHTSTYCTRPQERMRESWFRDRKLHGGRQYDEKKLEKQINEWNTQYAKFQKSKAELVVKANVLGTSIRLQQNALRYATLYATWFGGKFVDELKANKELPECCTADEQDNVRLAEVLTQLSDFGTNCFELRELVTGMNILYKSVRTLKDELDKIDDPKLKAEALAANVWFRAAMKQSSFRWPREAQIDRLIENASERAAQLLRGVLANLKDDSKNDAVNNAAEYLFHGSATFPLRYKTDRPRSADQAVRRIVEFKDELETRPRECLSSKRYGMFLALVDGIFKVLRKKMKEKVDQLLKEPESSASRKAIDEHFYKKWDNRVTTNVGDVGDTSVSRLTLFSENYCRQPRRVRVLRQYVDIVDSKAAYVVGGEAAASSAAPAPVRRSARTTATQANENMRAEFPAPPAAPHSELLVNPEPHRSNMDLLLLGELIGALRDTPSMNYRIRYYTELEILDSKFQRRMERRPGRGDKFNPTLAASVVGGTDVDASLMATLEIVSRTCNLMAQGDEAGQLVADALMGKLTDDLDEEASRLKAAYDTSFGIAKDMPNMVLAAAIAAKKVNAKRLEAAKEAKEGAQNAILVNKALSAAHKTLNGTFNFFVRTMKMLRLERMRLYGLFTTDGLASLGLAREKEFAMHGSNEKNVAKLIKELDPDLRPNAFAMALRKVKAEVAFPGEDMGRLREAIERGTPPISQGVESEQVFNATLERVIRYSQLVVATSARLAKAKLTLDEVQNMNDEERIAWATKVRTNFLDAARKQRDRIKRADLAYERMLFQTRENYPNPDAKAEAQAAKKSKIAEEKAKKQQQKEREQAEKTRQTNAEIAKKREASIKLYKEFLKKRIAWNAKVQRTLDEIAATRMAEYRQEKDTLLAEGRDREAMMLVAPTRTVLGGRMNKFRRHTTDYEEFEDMRNGWKYTEPGQPRVWDGIKKPVYVRAPDTISRAMAYRIRARLRPERDWDTLPEFVWEERATDAENAAAAADVIEEDDLNLLGVPPDTESEPSSPRTTPMETEPGPSSPRAMDIDSEPSSPRAIPMDTDSEPPSPRDTPTEPGPSSSGDTPTETEPSPQQQAIEEDRQEEQLQQAIFDNNIDDNYNAMIAVDDVDFERFDFFNLQDSFEPALAEVASVPEDRIRDIITKFKENALLKAKYVEPEPSTKLYVVEMEREKIFGALKNLEDDALRKYDKHQATVREVAEAQDELLRMLPILVEAGPSSRSDLSLDRLNEALHAESSTVKSVFSPDSRLEGGWKAAYHDYVYSMMLFRFPKGVGEIESRLTAVPLTPMQWARSDLAKGAYPPLRWLPPAAPEGESAASFEPIDKLFDAEDGFAKRYGPWVPYGFDFAPIMATTELTAEAE